MNFTNESWEKDIFSLLNVPYDISNELSWIRSYRLDKRDEWYYFFPKCPEDVLEVSVYECHPFEVHHIETSLVQSRRCLLIPKLSLEELEQIDQSMFDKGYKKSGSRYIGRSSMAFRYENGLMIVSKSSLICLKL